MSINDVGMLFSFIGGLGMFLYGMNIMADGLQKSAGGRMQKLMSFLTKNRLMAILVGAGITAIIPVSYTHLKAPENSCPTTTSYSNTATEK